MVEEKLVSFMDRGQRFMMGRGLAYEYDDGLAASTDKANAEQPSLVVRPTQSRSQRCMAMEKGDIQECR